jgi:hypothetical protein
MHYIFRHLTLNHLGVGLFFTGLVLLVVGLSRVLDSWGSHYSTSVRFIELNGPQSLLLGLASLVFSAIVFGLAIMNERLTRIEAELNSRGKGSGWENRPTD